MRLLPIRLAALLLLSATLPAADKPLGAGGELEDLVTRLRTGAPVVIGGEPVCASAVLVAFYERRGYQPAWSEPRAAEALLAALQDLETDGLDPRHYHAGLLAQALVGAGPHRFGEAELDLLATDALLHAAHHVRFGKVEQPTGRVNRDVSRPLAGDDPVRAFEALAAAPDPGAALETLRPDHAIYRGLRDALASYRAMAAAGGWKALPGGATLRLGDASPAVEALRSRLAVTGDLAPDSGASGAFDAVLEAAVRRFQHRHALNEDGIVGPATRAELDLPVGARVQQIRANLERARWLLHGLPETFVAVNVAGQRLYLLRDGEVAWETRVIVGKALTRTPVFSASLEGITLNPSWTVPASITGEIVESVRRDPDYLEREGMRVLDARGAEVAPSAIDFHAYGSGGFPYRFRQDPGPRNALGHIKFVSPNPYAVYLHDTPQRRLFEREQRTFSHGCIRVLDARHLAHLLLADPERWSEEALQAAIDAGETCTIALESPLPLLVLYWTAATDLHHELHFYRDVYGRDEPLLRALERP